MLSFMSAPLCPLSRRPSVCRWSSTAHLQLSGPNQGKQMRNKWALSGTHEGRRYAYHSDSGGLFPNAPTLPQTKAPFLLLCPSACLLYLRNLEILQDRGGMGYREAKDKKGERMVFLGDDRFPLYANTFSQPWRISTSVKTLTVPSTHHSSPPTLPLAWPVSASLQLLGFAL